MKDRVKVYLDTSVYNRPFDDQRQTRIRLETEAFLFILEKALSGAIIIVIKKAKKDESLFKIKVCNPLVFVLEEVFKNA